jgi:gallate dioxygenase
LHRSYYLPSMTGIATAIYEPVAQGLPAPALKRHRALIGLQLAGVEALPGTYPFTLARSVKAYGLNRFLHRLVEPGHRARFLADEEACLRESDLDDGERELIRRRDWRGLIRHGAIFFVLEKLGAVTGVSNLHIYAAMRGESLEAFQRTRNAPNALYSVAGKDAGALGWDAPITSPTA